MVWYNGSSELDKAVERHNSSANTDPPPPAEKVHAEKPCEPPPRRQMRQPDMLTELMNDRDFLLLAALMLILMHEKADKKLILALAFVLFS